MAETKCKSLNSNIGTFLVLLLLGLFTLNITNIRSDIIIQVLIHWFVGGMALFSLVFLQKKMKLQDLYLICFSVYIVMITIINQSMNSSALFINFGYMTLWIWVILLFNYSNLKNDFNEKLFELISFFSIVIGVYIMHNYEPRKLVSDWGFVNNNYYLLCVMPILFLIKKGWLKRISILISCMTVLLSLKRTAILALIAILFCLILYYFRYSPRYKIRAVAASIVFLIVALNYNKITEYLGINVLSRFDSLDSDGGSGRTLIYKECIKVISDGGILHFLFGCGYNGLINYYGSEVSSHNDILEIMIDYGLVGLTAYLCVILHYVKICIYNIKNCSPYAEACIVSICAFAFITLFGHCVIYPSYFMFILVFWIYIDNKTKIQKYKINFKERERIKYENWNINIS